MSIWAAAPAANTPEWWQLMLQYGLAPALVAIVSTVALIIQNKSNNDRDDRRRADDSKEREKDRAEMEKDRAERAREAQADRTHAQELARMEHEARAADLAARHEQEHNLAAAAQGAELAERWRDERRQAHLTVLPIFERALDQLVEVRKKIEYTDDEYVKRIESGQLSALNNAFRDEIAKAVADVQIIASERGRTTANECFEALKVADVRMWAATLPMDRPSNYTRDDIGQVMQDASDALKRYVDSVRAELGTLA